MSGVIEVKPTGWQDNSEGKVGTGPGNDCRNVFMDKDGATVWALQSTDVNITKGAGFARIRLSDGAILFSGNWNNSTSTILQQRFANAGVPIWIQIGSNYFVVEYATSILHKMIVSPSSVGSWGNGYLTDVATLNLSANLPTSARNVGVFTNGNVGGVNYIVITLDGQTGIGGKNLIVVNADTMALVGTWTFPAPFLSESISTVTNPGIFFDKFGALWVVSFGFNTTTDTHGFNHGMFVSTGSVATPSGLTTTFIPASSLPTNFFVTLPETYTTYNSSNHSIVLGTVFINDINNDQGMMVLSLGSLTSIASRISNNASVPSGDDVAWWDADNQAGNYCAFLIGIQSDGSLNVPAANTDGSTVYSASLSKLNPTTLAQISNVDVVTAINNSTVPDKPPLNIASALGISGIAFNSSLIIANFAADVTNIQDGGSPVYMVPLGLCGAPAPLGNPFIK